MRRLPAFPPTGRNRQGLIAALGLLLVAGGFDASAQAQYMRRSQRCCPPTTPYSPSATPDSSTTDPQTGEPRMPGDQAAPDQANQMTNPDQVFNNAPAPAPATPLASNSAPNTIGDFFGTTGASTQYYSGLLPRVHTSVPAPSSSVLGRQKLVENDSPLPRDRAFANYSYFDNVPLITGGATVQRLTVGAEKTFLDGMSSIQVRLPTGRTIDSDLYTLAPDDNNYEMGNVTFTGKLLLSQSQTCSLAAGVAVTIPTADDIRIYDATGIQTLRYDNEAFHILPYVGVVLTPSYRCFSTAVVQFDFDANGNPVHALDTPTNNFEQVGTANDANFVFASYSAGYWLMRRDSQFGIEQGFAPMVEVHYSRSMRNPDDIIATTSNGNVVNILSDSVQAFNVVLGVNIQCNRCSNLMVGYATPVSNSSFDDQFDGEVRVIFNYLFGRPGCGQSCCSR